MDEKRGGMENTFQERIRLQQLALDAVHFGTALAHRSNILHDNLARLYLFIKMDPSLGRQGMMELGRRIEKRKSTCEGDGGEEGKGGG